ncbi:MAG TPA: hypothetical protein VK449_06475 [Anaerolineales bacterium]|nr:hypothetical protein [Anaerolineales bacterium]
MTSLSTTSAQPRRWDVLALWGGIAFSLAFTALIAWLGPRLDAIPLLPDRGAAWYYWKLPQPTFWTHATAWGFYLANQITAWALIYYGQTRVRKYSTGLQPINLVALATTAVFIFLHLIQTHIWYDGLAQDVSIFSSQGSVIVLLVWVLLMENNRRGMFWGKKLPLGQEIVRWARTYHGYFFAWAAIYTFWFHPMVSTPGHLIGFIYMFFLLLQGSLMYTRVHVNRWWTVTLELMVMVHGTLVAIAQGAGLWPMFFFGFGGIFVITQMHGLGLKLWTRLLILAGYGAAVIAVYSRLGWARINEIIRIPVIDYLAVLLLAGLIAGGLWVARRLKARLRGAEMEVAA